MRHLKEQQAVAQKKTAPEGAVRKSQRFDQPFGSRFGAGSTGPAVLAALPSRTCAS
jgi:hypothetical protein